MKIPYFIGIPGWKLPDWLASWKTNVPMEMITAKVTFGTLVLVTNKSGVYRVRRVFPVGHCVFVDCAPGGVHINFKSPPNGLGVNLDMNPIVPVWLVSGVVGVALGIFVAVST